MKYLLTILIGLLPVMAMGQGTTIRALNGLGTNLTLRGSNKVGTNLLVTAVPSATIGGTNVFEVVNQDTNKVFQVGTNGNAYFHSSSNSTTPFQVLVNEQQSGGQKGFFYDTTLGDNSVSSLILFDKVGYANSFVGGYSGVPREWAIKGISAQLGGNSGQVYFPIQLLKFGNAGGGFYSASTFDVHLTTSVNILTITNGTAATAIAVNVGGTITATNGVFGAYGCMTVSTGVVTTGASAGPNNFTNFHYLKSFGGISIVTNTAFLVSNAGDYRISFGAAMQSGAADSLALQVFTNNVECSIAQLIVDTPAVPIYETSFKEFIVTLPAATYVHLASTNSDTSAQLLKNVVFNIGGAN